MNIAFRIDISRELGTGHFVRMSALAEAFAELGHKCSFFKGEDEPVDFSSFDIVVIDTYLVNDEYIKQLHKPGQLLVCYDDNALYTYDCDLLLNANLYASELKFKTTNRPPKMLLGGQYALLRREFRESKSIIISEKGSNIFVCFGGTDLHDMTPRTVETLRSIEGVNLFVVLGGYTKCDDAVRSVAGSNVNIFKTPESMHSIMSECDIAVTSSGSMTYELAVMGLPAVTITQADNQRLLAEYMTRTGLMKNIGDWQSVDFAHMRDEVVALLRDTDRRRNESAALSAAVNKDGAMNAAKNIIKQVYKANSF